MIGLYLNILDYVKFLEVLYYDSMIIVLEVEFNFVEVKYSVYFIFNIDIFLCNLRKNNFFFYKIFYV